MRVIDGGFKRPVNSAFVAELRALADRIESGENDTALVAYMHENAYQISISASPQDALVMAAMAYNKANHGLYEGPQ